MGKPRVPGRASTSCWPRGRWSRQARPTPASWSSASAPTGRASTGSSPLSRTGDVDGRSRGGPSAGEARAARAGELSYLAAPRRAWKQATRASVPATASTAFPSVHFTGRLEHGDLPDLPGSVLAQVVPARSSRGVRDGGGGGRGVRRLAACRRPTRGSPRSLIQQPPAGAVDRPVRPPLVVRARLGGERGIAGKLEPGWRRTGRSGERRAAGAVREARRRFGWDRAAGRDRGGGGPLRRASAAGCLKAPSGASG